MHAEMDAQPHALRAPVVFDGAGTIVGVEAYDAPVPLASGRTATARFVLL